MKILEEGKNWSYKARCTGKGWEGSGCDALLEVEEDDVYRTSHTDIAGDTEYYYTFRCPICYQQTDISNDVLPEKVKMKARGYYPRRFEIER